MTWIFFFSRTHRFITNEGKLESQREKEGGREGGREGEGEGEVEEWGGSVRKTRY